jgi:hypothetical protein
MRKLDPNTNRVESLLREAAEWEPETACPAGLAERALAALEPEGATAARRPAVGFLTTLMGGGAISTALAGGLLAVGLPHPADPLAGREPLPKHPPAAQRVAAIPVSPAAPPARRAAVSRRVPVLRRARPTAKPPTPAAPQIASAGLWRTEEVEREEARVIAPALLLQPDGNSGELLIRTGVIDLPAATACRPPDGPDGETALVALEAAPLPEAPAAPEENN